MNVTNTTRPAEEDGGNGAVRVVRKATCITVCDGREVLGSFVGPDAERNAETFRAALVAPAAPGAAAAAPTDTERLDWLEANAVASWGGDYKVWSVKWMASEPLRGVIDFARAAQAQEK